MRHRQLWPTAGLLLVLLLLSGGWSPPGPPPLPPDADASVQLTGQDPLPSTPTLERFTVDPRRTPIETGDHVPMHAVIEGAPGQDRARLHVVVDRSNSGPAPEAELEPAPVELGSGQPALIVAFWQPEEPGRYEIDGHVHAGDQRLDLPDRSAEVHQAADPQPVDGSTLSVGIAPGTVLWALVFVGLAVAAHVRDRGES